MKLTNTQTKWIAHIVAGVTFALLDYPDEVNRRLRQHFNTPAEGKIILYRVDLSVMKTTKNTTA